MKDIGFDEEELEEVCVVLAAIILIGDIVSHTERNNLASL